MTGHTVAQSDLDDGTAGTAVDARGFLSLSRRKFFPDNPLRVSAERLKGFGKLGLLARHITYPLSAKKRSAKEAGIDSGNRKGRRINKPNWPIRRPKNCPKIALLIRIKRTT